MKKIALFYLSLILICFNLNATHLRGGYFTVKAQRSGSQFQFVTVLHLYSEYTSDPNLQIPPDQSAFVGVYKNNTLLTTTNMSKQQSRLYFGCYGDTFYHTTYIDTFLLDSVVSGYVLQYSRCCRENIPRINDTIETSDQAMGFYTTLPCIHGFESPEPDFPVIVNSMQGNSLKLDLAFSVGSGYDSSSIDIRQPFAGHASVAAPLPSNYPTTASSALLIQKTGFTDTTPLGSNSHLYIQNDTLILDFVDSNDGYGALEQRLFYNNNEIFRSNIELIFFTEEQQAFQPNAGKAVINCDASTGQFKFSVTACPQTYPPLKIYLYQTLDTTLAQQPKDSCLYNPEFTFTGVKNVTNFFRLSYQYPASNLQYTEWVGINCWAAGVNKIGSEETLVVFPNPAQNTLQLGGKSIPEKVVLISVSGQAVCLPVTDKTVDVSGLARGMYVLKTDNTVQKIVLY